MKALVTGAAGFIGSHLCDLLLEEGFEVVGLDNLACGRMRNLTSALKQDRFTFVEADIRSAEEIPAAFAGVDHVYHLAGLADIVPSIERPDDYYAVNVTGTFNVLQAANKAKVKRVVYAASSSCYGIATQFPTPETAQIDTQYPYALTKYLGEELVMHWAKVYDLPAVSLRLFNVFGPRSRTTGTYGAVFGVFLAQKLADKPFTVVGDGTQTRDFTFVRDVASAFYAAACSNVSAEIYNVGSDGHYSVNTLVEHLGGEVTYIPKRPGEPDRTHADIAKITRDLHWKPSISFEDGVKILLEHIDDFRDAPVWDSDSIATATKSWFKYLGKEELAGV